MQPYRPRSLSTVLQADLTRFPAVVLLGPRQCGKTTLVKQLGLSLQGFVYRDLERPQDLRQLDDPELFLESNATVCLCLDEVQRLPGLFPILRSFIDRHERRTRVLLLGSASPTLLKGTAESLAGRVVYRELTPFLLNEVGNENLRQLWLQGGYPLSVLATPSDSYEWRQAFVQAVVGRDLPELARLSPVTLSRFVRMLSLVHGQNLNLSSLGNSLGVSGHTVRHYLELLQGTYHVRLLEPWQTNHGKRLVKTPKVYFRDTGVLHALWETPEFNGLLAHPLFGASWEGFVLEQVCSRFPQARYSFYRTATGVEADLVIEYRQHRLMVETKASSAPVLTKGFWTAVDDLQPTASFVVALVETGWALKKGAHVVSLPELLARLESLLALIPPTD